MPEWSLLQWLDAGDVPLLVVIILLLWRLERRVLVLELLIKHKGTPNAEKS